MQLGQRPPRTVQVGGSRSAESGVNMYSGVKLRPCTSKATLLRCQRGDDIGIRTVAWSRCDSHRSRESSHTSTFRHTDRLLLQSHERESWGQDFAMASSSMRGIYTATFDASNIIDASHGGQLGTWAGIVTVSAHDPRHTPHRSAPRMSLCATHAGYSMAWTRCFSRAQHAAEGKPVSSRNTDFATACSNRGVPGPDATSLHGYSLSFAPLHAHRASHICRQDGCIRRGLRHRWPHRVHVLGRHPL